VTNDAQNKGVTWSATGGSFTPSGSLTAKYTAPATAGVYTLTATSVTDVTKSASLTFGVTDLLGVFTYHSNLSRDGTNANEYALTPSNVTSITFGRLFSCSVDGAIYAQPLWAANLAIGGAKHNVVFVATQHDSLYAFDADASPCAQLWHVSLIDAAHGGSSSETTVPSGPSGHLVGGGAGDITPEVGVTGTPVIDPSSNTLYVVSKSVIPSGPTFYQRLHAIDITTGAEKSGMGSPVTIAGTYPGTGDGGTTVTFNAGQQNQRPALALANGVVYIAWASHEDTGPYYGWVMGFNAATLAQTAVLNVTPNVGYGGIWMGGGGPSVDSGNNLYLITGNGIFDVTNKTAPNNDYGDSFLKLTSGLSVSQYFTPSDQANDNASDADFGSGGSAILVDQPAGPVQHLVIGGGKDGYLYLLNRDAMGGLGDANAWQRFNFGSPIFATGAFWNDTFYMAGVSGHLQAFSFNTTTGQFNTANVLQSAETYGFPGSTPSVSASGTTNGIVWALDNSNYCTNQSPGCGPAVLHAYNASNLATELWNSTMGTGNEAGNAVKFTVPTVANGKVYVGTRGNNTGGSTTSTTVPGELEVYGLLGGPAKPILLNSGGPSYTDSQGQLWSADMDFTGGSSGSTTHTIANTTDPTLYQTERYGNSTYQFSVPPGNYTVILKFAEIYWTAAGKRIFNASINGTQVLSNFDIVAAAGAAFTAIDKSFPVTVTANSITIQFTTGSADLPKISAIEITNANASGVLVQVNPSTASLYAAQQQQFTSTVTGNSNTAVTWSYSPQVGTLTAGGLYTAPASVTTAQTVSVTATSQADTTKSATPTISLLPGSSTFSPIFVHSGGGAYTDTLGNNWSADMDFTGGYSASTTHTIANTTDPTLYQTERYGNSTYQFSVPPGNYTVILKFAEIYWTAAGKRIFNASINGTQVLSNFDIVAAAGAAFTAIDKSFPVTVTANSITIQFTTGSADLPKISAIEITNASGFSPIFVHSGGGGYTDTLGNNWSADMDFTGGNSAGTSSNILNTTDTKLYQTERWGSFSYQFAVPNGSYNVVLKFAEIYWTGVGQRIFNVSINGSPVLSNFDIVAAAGAPLTAIDKTFPVTVTNQLVTIQFTRGSADNPKVSAVEIH